MHCAGFGIWDLDVPAERVRFSPAWKVVLGYADDDAAERTSVWRSRVHADDLQGMLTALYESIHGTRDNYEHEFRVRDADGRYRCVLSRGRVVERGAQGLALRLLGTMTDLSDRRQAEALRLELDRTEAANRVKTEFLARMSHELRTPLNAVLGFTQLLVPMVGSADTDRQRQYLAQIGQAGWTLLKMIEEMLAVTERESKRATQRETARN